MQRFQSYCSVTLITVIFILTTHRPLLRAIKQRISPMVLGANNRKVIVAFGDSLTEGLFDWPRSRSFHPYTIKLQELINNEVKRSGSILNIVVRNFGVSGERLQKSMKRRLRKIISSENPNYVVILGGTNDLLDIDKQANGNGLGETLNAIVQDTQTLHLYCHYKGIPTAALSIPETAMDNRSENSTVAMMRRTVNKEIQDFVMRNQTKSTFIDISNEIHRRGNEQYWDDGVHFSPKGYDRMGEVVYRELRGVIAAWIRGQKED